MHCLLELTASSDFRHQKSLISKPPGLTDLCGQLSWSSNLRIRQKVLVPQLPCQFAYYISSIHSGFLDNPGQYNCQPRNILFFLFGSK